MEGEIFTDTTIKKIIERYKTIWALSHLSALGSWDLEVFMPMKGAFFRGEALGRVSSLIKRLFLDKEFVGLLGQAESKLSKLNDYEKGVVRVVKRELKIYQALPSDFLEEWERTTNQAKVVWREAKKQDNFRLFQPYLQKLVELAIKKAEYLGYSKHPYDALLDLYEEGWRSEEVEEFFEEIYQPLKTILNRVISGKNYQPTHPLEKAPYKQKKAEELNCSILDKLGMDWQRFRMDVSAHPFTESISADDVRITTWYHQKDFARTITATVHEAGHALYELQIDSRLATTPLGGGVSLGIHESQSRFWENFVARNRVFLGLFLPKFAQLSPEIEKFIKKEGVGGIYRYFNLVRPGLIRVEADELTYHFHIKLRFELEKGLIERKIKVEQLPELWREKMGEYLGVKPKTDKEGVLQDIHWSMGAFGYFPTYSLGTFISGMIKERLEKELGEMEELIAQDGLIKIKRWLGERVHRFGSLYSPKKLLGVVVGKPFTPKPLLNYLRKKFLEK